MNSETKTHSQGSVSNNCQNCKTDFKIEPDDFVFYEKIKVPPPTFCPECRMQRRLAWRNSMSLFNRKCDLCEKSVVSLYAPDSGITVYCNKCWWSDNWDPKDYALDYDFTKPFFTQYKELIQKIPHIAMVNDDGIASVNCEYTNDWWFAKNCYMCFSGWKIENVMYSFFITAGKDLMDCIGVQADSQWMYECVNSARSFNLKYSELSSHSMDSSFLYDCRNCEHCFMSVGLRNKKYCFKNQEYTKEKYEKIISEYKLDTHTGVERAKKEFQEFVLSYPHKYSFIYMSTPESTGDVLLRCKNTKESFFAKGNENCKFCDFASFAKDSYDLTMSGELSECYEGAIVDHSSKNFFGLFSVKSNDIYYTQHCHSSKYLFGCSQLRSSKYCILNKQYTKEEYEEMIPKIIEHMNTMPYVDKKGNIYKYGEYYPIELSVFGYNETVAPEQFPFTKEQAVKNEFKWQDNLQCTKGKQTLELKNIPDSILEVDDSIAREILSCAECDRNYKIVPNELIFYKKMNIPIPHRCFYCRHQARLKQRNPFKLWHRQCMCEKENHQHEGKCEIEFETSYAPDRPEIVYCEKCYQQEVI